MGTDQNGLMGGHGHGGAGGGILGGNQNDVGEGGVGKGASEAEEGHLGLEVVDLVLELLLGFVGLLIALLAGTGVVGFVVLQARYALHRLRRMKLKSG